MLLMGTGHGSKSTVHPFIAFFKVFHLLEFLWCYTTRIQPLSRVSGMKLLLKGPYFIMTFLEKLRFMLLSFCLPLLGSLTAFLSKSTPLLKDKLVYRKPFVVASLIKVDYFSKYTNLFKRHRYLLQVGFRRQTKERRNHHFRLAFVIGLIIWWAKPLANLDLNNLPILFLSLCFMIKQVQLTFFPPTNDLY